MHTHTNTRPTCNKQYWRLCGQVEHGGHQTHYMVVIHARITRIVWRHVADNGMHTPLTVITVTHKRACTHSHYAIVVQTCQCIMNARVTGSRADLAVGQAVYCWCVVHGWHGRQVTRNHFTTRVRGQLAGSIYKSCKHL
jgi:hypothetical protein